jgi:putative DNA primase/helicase
MSTAVLMHGPEGSGKNFFWGSLAAIYGDYAVSISQTELESQFNGWASAKLFCIGNEVVQRAELYHQQGRLKTMITESSWMVNQKNLPARQEANHANFVFLSNRLDIAKLDRNDRRYAVIWTPEGLGEDFYRELKQDIDAGAVAALHDYLLRLPLGDFGPHTKPPMTAAKAELIDLSMDSPERFWQDWVHQRLPVPCRPLMAEQLYEVYRVWCGRQGIHRPAPSHIVLAAIGKQPGVLRQPERFSNPSRLGYLKRRIVYPPGQHQPPAGITRVTWLGDCVEASDKALEEYKAGVLVSDPDEVAA